MSGLPRSLAASRGTPDISRSRTRCPRDVRTPPRVVSRLTRAVDDHDLQPRGEVAEVLLGVSGGRRPGGL